MNRFLHVPLLILCLSCLRAQMLDLRLAGAEARTYGNVRPPILAQYGDKPGLAFHATFLTDGPARVVWDLHLRENLTHCAGVKLRFFCYKPTIVRQFKLSLKTQDCWQSTVFTPVDSGLWQEVYIPKATFRPETKPCSWQQVSAMRLVLTRGATGRTALHLASVEWVRPNCSLAIVRSGTTNANCKTAFQYADILSRTLETGGLLPAVMDQADTSYLSLRPYHVLCLPLPGVIPPTQLNHILAFIQRGGKAMVFHNLPPLLQQQMRLPAGRFVSVSSLGLDISGVRFRDAVLPGAGGFRQHPGAFMAVGRLIPPLSVVADWTQGAGQATPYPAVIRSPGGYWMTHVYQGEDREAAADAFTALIATHLPDIHSVAAAQCYESMRQAYHDAPLTPAEKAPVRTLLERARELYGQHQFTAAIRRTREARRALALAANKPAPARADELRAVWADLSAKLPGTTWQKTVNVLVQGDINGVITPVASPVVANFASKTAPLMNPRTALKDAIRTCRSNGIQVHAWFNCLSLEGGEASLTHTQIVQQWREQKRLQMNQAGETLNWLCPSQLVNRRHLVRLAAEMATELELDGLQLDCIRYPSQDACYCPACRQAFQLYLGRSTNWPQDVRRGGADYAQWLQFREQVMSSLVAEISAAARQARGTLVVSAAVVPDLDTARTQVGQNWNNWLDYNYLNLVSPLNYYDSTAQFQARLQRQAQQSQMPQRLLPGIGLTPHALSLQETQRQVQSTRQAGTAGFILYRLGLREAQEVIPYVIQH